MIKMAIFTRYNNQKLAVNPDLVAAVEDGEPVRVVMNHGETYQVIGLFEIVVDKIYQAQKVEVLLHGEL